MDDSVTTVFTLDGRAIDIDPPLGYALTDPQLLERLARMEKLLKDLAEYVVLNLPSHRRP